MLGPLASIVPDASAFAQLLAHAVAVEQATLKRQQREAELKQAVEEMSDVSDQSEADAELLEESRLIEKEMSDLATEDAELMEEEMSDVSDQSEADAELMEEAAEEESAEEAKSDDEAKEESAEEVDEEAELQLLAQYCKELMAVSPSFGPLKVGEVDVVQWTDPVLQAALACGPGQCGLAMELLQLEGKTHLVCEPLLWQVLAPAEPSGSKAPPAWCPGTFNQYSALLRAWSKKAKCRNPLMREYLAFWASLTSDAVGPAVAAEALHAEVLEVTMDEHRITRDEIKSHMAAELDKRLGTHVPGESADAVVKRLEMQLGAAKCLRSQEREKAKEAKTQAKEQTKKDKEAKAQAKRAQKEEQAPKKRARR